MKIRKMHLYTGVIIIVITPVVLFALYFLFTGGKGAYKLSQTRGFSKNIEESKERGVYLFEFDHRIQPDSLEFAIPPIFFLEKGFRYGEWRASDTEPLLDKSKPYQIGVSGSKLFNYDIFIENYYANETWQLNTTSLDTVKFNLMSKSPPYDGIYKVGELKLFKKE